MFPCTRYLCLYNYITTAKASPAVQFKKRTGQKELYMYKGIYVYLSL
jgi:hypothetical protein